MIRSNPALIRWSINIKFKALGVDLPTDLTTAPLEVRLLTSLYCDREMAYGSGTFYDAWEELSNLLNQTIPERVAEGLQNYFFATRASLNDMIKELEDVFRRRLARRATL